MQIAMQESYDQHPGGNHRPIPPPLDGESMEQLLRRLENYRRSLPHAPSGTRRLLTLLIEHFERLR